VGVRRVVAEEEEGWWWRWQRRRSRSRRSRRRKGRAAPSECPSNTPIDEARYQEGTQPWLSWTRQ